MKKLVRWTATYETLIEVADGEDERDIAANIPLDVPGSLYQTDTWEVDTITIPNDDEVAVHEAIQS